MDQFRVRLNCIDFYLTAPSRFDPRLRNGFNISEHPKDTKVPVIRVFGSTETGQKVCAHIHGAFPYLYVEYEGSLEPGEAGSFIYRLHLSIDHALAISYRSNQNGDEPKFVARITLVKGIPFYGFHVGYKTFLKIYMFNPMVMTRLADLLQQGAIMKRIFQPYEAHLQYLLQFMTDYNLYGCAYLDSSKTFFRSPVPDDSEDGVSTAHLWHSASVPAQYVTSDPAMPRVSHCSIEVDICVEDITNRGKIKERRLHHDFSEFINPSPHQSKLVSSMAGLWKDEARRRQRQKSLAEPVTNSFPPEALVSMSAGSRDSQPPCWVHEAEYQKQIQELISHENSIHDGTNLTFQTFTRYSSCGEFIKTALQSVEDLYPSNLIPLLGLTSSATRFGGDLASSIEVDERKARLLYADQDDNFADDSNNAMKDSVHARANFRLRKDSQHFEEKERKSFLNLADEVHLEPESFLFGIALSAFQTGLPPKIPVTAALLDVVENNHLSFKSQKPISPMSTRSLQLKRGAFDVSTAKPRKRIRGSDNTSVTTKTASGSLSNLQSTPAISGERVNAALESSNREAESALALDFVQSQKEQQVLAEGEGSSSVTSHGFDKTTGLWMSGFELSSPLPSAYHSDLPTGESTHNAGATSGFHSREIIYAFAPPTHLTVALTHEYGVPDVLYRDVFYGNEDDAPRRKREYAGKDFRILSNTVPFLPEFDPTGKSLTTNGKVEDFALLGRIRTTMQYRKQRVECSFRSWEIADPPPPFQHVKDWFCTGNTAGTIPPSHNQSHSRHLFSQVDGPTPENRCGFKYRQNWNKSTSVRHEVQYMSLMSLEVHANTRGGFVPNPEQDEIQCVFWSCRDDGSIKGCQNSVSTQSGIVVLCTDKPWGEKLRRMTSMEVVEESSELDLIVRIVDIVRTYDPDILTGYEVHGSSWGFLIERARLQYDYDLCDEFSRMKSQSRGRFGRQSDQWGFNTTSSIRITGRHMINIWRAMRGELNLLQYTMENVAWHLLHRRIPHYSWQTLTAWYQSGQARNLHRLLKHYQRRTHLDIKILECNELVQRTSEQARLLGIDFFSVFSRGSQFKVESIMFRIAKPENFMLVSPSRKQVGKQNALECLPLVMEPQSAFYTSPMVVLDFQSLYPSVMIAYNYCYSTFLGRITNWRGKSKMGFAEYQRQEGLLALLEGHINIAPNGMMYVKAEVRKSLLAKMLTEILETRIMVKSGMKQDVDDKQLQQLLNNRQLALKLLANVTYGYTSASFSGRMPCSEIADSIVQTGRETLERATAYIHSVEQWGAEVVYGDTDSLFVHLKDRTRDEAFEIGNEIAKAITNMNPRPMKLKFEKVYHPCVLLTKKRYVGYKYENKDQVQPIFDAKGIETVRRDGTPAEQKIEEKALRILFETADLSQIKEYFQNQCEKIMRGRVSVQDFCFAREVKLGTYSDQGTTPAGALISTRRMLEDARAEPQYGERVPYVVVTGPPGARLIDRCVAPEELLKNPHWQLDADYYITKNLIPPLERIFNLVGANVRQWYDEMPKVRHVSRIALSNRKSTLEAYMKSKHCLACGRKFTGSIEASLCRTCFNSPETLRLLQERIKAEESKHRELLSVCRSCEGLGPLQTVECDSKDCAVFWTRMKQKKKKLYEEETLQPLIELLTTRLEKGLLNW